MSSLSSKQPCSFFSPFFGEEFQFEVPRKFRYLSIYLYDRDRHLKQDKVLGKVAIKREDLSMYNNKDHWFAIRPVDADSEVQGKANIFVSFEPPFGKSHQQLFVKVVECTELTLKNGSCDPYALVSALYSNGKKESKRTKVRKKTASPQFDEAFYFGSYDERDKDKEFYIGPDSDTEICELHVSLWHDSRGMNEDVFLGEVRIQLRGAQQQQHASNKSVW